MTEKWVVLVDGKELSRLLYTNPVCLLTTGKIEDDNNIISSSKDENVTPKSEEISVLEVSPSCSSSYMNVMTISWLTPINNDGALLFSINRRRFTAARVTKIGCKFTLSVPVKGMEQLVKDIGRSSGHDQSKFPSDYSHDQPSSTTTNTTSQDLSATSKKRRKKKEDFERGVTGLRSIPMRQNILKNEDHYVVDGTVAHILCETVHVNADLDEEHFICTANMLTANVDARYWNEEKRQFCSRQPETPPYLAFLGAQTFGYVVSSRHIVS